MRGGRNWRREEEGGGRGRTGILTFHGRTPKDDGIANFIFAVFDLHFRK